MKCITIDQIQAYVRKLQECLLVSHPYVQSHSYADIAKPLLEEERSRNVKKITPLESSITKKKKKVQPESLQTSN